MEKGKYLKFINKTWPEAEITIKDIKTNKLVNLFNSNDFFANQLQLKLGRLYKNYSQNPKMIDKIKKLSNRGWEGAFSEIIAYDFFNLVLPFSCEIEIENILIENTLAKHIEGKNSSSIDGYMSDYMTYFEVKTLANTITNLVEKLKKEFSTNAEIDCEYSSDIECDESYFPKIKAELKIAIDKEETFLISKTCPKLQFRIHYRKVPVRISINSSNLYKQAEEWEKLPLNKYHQFLENGSFLKVFVSHKIFNEYSIIIDSKDFFRALARRVFCRLTKEEGIIDTDSNLEIKYIAKKIGGLLFIVDNSFEPLDSYSKDKPITIYKAYLYSNPNADFNNKLICFRNLCFDFNKGFQHECDDFEFDNY